MAARARAAGVALGWLAAIVTPTVPYTHLVVPFIIAGVGMGLFFAPVANVVLSAVRLAEQGQASGANNALREIGGVFGVGRTRGDLREPGRLLARPRPSWMA